jgi:hypothetical protein
MGHRLRHVLPIVALVGVAGAALPDDAEAKKKYRCRGRVATIVGTKHADRIAGTRKKDVIVGLGGADRIDGKGKRDIICGQGGADDLIGGKGSDTLIGGSGDDWLRGHGGLLDKLEGGPGKDRLSGGGGPDLLLGGPGRDKLNGGTWPDVLFGGAGKDQLLGAQGADVLDGGTGADVMRGNSGPDTVSYSGRSKPVFVTLSSGDPNDGEQDEKDHITSTENVLGGSGDDQITGYGALNILTGNGQGQDHRAQGERPAVRQRRGRRHPGRLPHRPDRPHVLRPHRERSHPGWRRRRRAVRRLRQGHDPGRRR